MTFVSPPNASKKQGLTKQHHNCHHGRGRVVYIGSMGQDLYDYAAQWLLQQAGIKPLMNVPEGIEVAERWLEDRRLLFLLNHTEQELTVTIDEAHIDLLNDSAAVYGEISVSPFGVIILADKP